MENKEKAVGRLNAIAEGEWINGEVEHFHKGGHLFPVEWAAGPVTINGNRYALVFITDITDRKTFRKPYWKKKKGGKLSKHSPGHHSGS